MYICLRKSSGCFRKISARTRKVVRFAMKKTQCFFFGKIRFRKKFVSTYLHCLNVATPLEFKFTLNGKWNSLGDLKVAQHYSKEVKVLNIHVHIHVMKIHAHWYMFRKGIGGDTSSLSCTVMMVCSTNHRWQKKTRWWMRPTPPPQELTSMV